MSEATPPPLKLFEKQQKVYPRHVSGVFRRLKWLVMALLLGIYYLAPWLRWDRGPYAPEQAILIDMPARRAYFFNIEIWPQEVYILTGILVLAAVGLFFVTSLFGRAWCGYACPQTVWTDLFVWAERLVQGDRNQRMRLDAAPLSFTKALKKVLTHALWLVIGVSTGGAWVFYFNDAPTLVGQIMHGTVPASVLGWVGALTLSTYIMAGYAREQVCTYMCPYARFQSAMFDRDTLIVSYDKDRGEPRGKHKAGDSWDGRGHCIDCDSCVAVCPVGIDIRNGLQYQCISCGLCIDACNSVMDKLALPHGLVRYDTERNHDDRQAAKNAACAAGLCQAGSCSGGEQKGAARQALRLLRPRSLYYMAVLSLVGALILYALATRTTQEISVLHDRNPLSVQLSDGSIRNSYTVKILNKTHEDQRFSLAVQGLDGANVKLQGAGHVDINDITVLADSVGQFRLLLSKNNVDVARQEIIFILRNVHTGQVATHESFFVDKRR